MTSDLFDFIMCMDLSPIYISAYDIDSGAFIKNTKLENRTFKERLRIYIFNKFIEKGFSVYIPRYKGEEFSLFASKGNDKIIIHLLLDSEDERVGWRVLELKDKGYKLAIVREREEKEISPIVGLSLEDVVNCDRF